MFDVANKAPAPWAESFNLHNPQILSEARDELLGIAIEPLSANGSDEDLSLICWGATFTTSIRIPSKAYIAGLRSQGLKRTSDDQVRSNPKSSFYSARLTRKFTDIISVEFARNGELLVVERPYMDLLPNMPAAVATKRYGRA